MLFETSGRPDDRQLRQFASALIVFVAIVIALRVWRGHAVGPIGLVLAALGGVLGALGVVLPRSIAWLFVAATTVTRPIGLVVSELMLLLMYFGVVTPLAIAARLVGRDRLRRTIDRNATSYWVPRKPNTDPSRYFRES
jgi:hypothetical protein